MKSRIYLWLTLLISPSAFAEAETGTGQQTLAEILDWLTAIMPF